MVYLDSNVFIYAIAYNASRVKEASKAREIILDMSRGKQRYVSSLITWDEVVWVIWKLFGYEEAVKAGQTMLSLDGLEYIELSGTEAIKAQELVDKYGLRPRNALHAATAITSGETVIVSDDKELDVVKELRRIQLTSYGKH
jgi:predicted nucleic acid-binding protein